MRSEKKRYTFLTFITKDKLRKGIEENNFIKFFLYSFGNGFGLLLASKMPLETRLKNSFNKKN